MSEERTSTEGFDDLFDHASEGAALAAIKRAMLSANNPFVSCIVVGFRKEDPLSTRPPQVTIAVGEWGSRSITYYGRTVSDAWSEAVKGRALRGNV